MKKLLYIISLFVLIGCYSNNCPVNNTVTCNYYFYDSESGSAISYPDTFTISTLRPGTHLVYVYRKLGQKTITRTDSSQALIDSGYTQSTQMQRNDTTLANKLINQKYAQVPMSYFNKVDTLLFRYANVNLPDTVYVEHESYAHVDLPECGSYRYHNLIRIRSTHNAIDSMEIINPQVNYDQESNVKIYFNTTATNK